MSFLDHAQKFTAVASIGIAALFSSQSASQYMYDGAIVDTPGKAVMGSIALGVGQAFREAETLDTLTDVRLSLIKADMSEDMRSSLQSSEDLAYQQASAGEWTLEGLNSWIDAMIIDKSLIEDLTKTYSADVQENNWSRIGETLEQIASGAIDPEAMHASLKTLISLEASYHLSTSEITVMTAEINNGDGTGVDFDMFSQ